MKSTSVYMENIQGETTEARDVKFEILVSIAVFKFVDDGVEILEILRNYRVFRCEWENKKSYASNRMT